MGSNLRTQGYAKLADVMMGRQLGDTCGCLPPRRSLPLALISMADERYELPTKRKGEHLLGQPKRLKSVNPSASQPNVSVSSAASAYDPGLGNDEENAEPTTSGKYILSVIYGDSTSCTASLHENSNAGLGSECDCRALVSIYILLHV